jgi:hypothetical protein
MSLAQAKAAALFASCLALSAHPVRAQEDQNAQLGAVHFETSCNEAAARRFDRGMRYEHSFWYSAAREIFEDTAKSDPGCAIAYWGAALSLLSNPHGPIPAPNLAPGLAAIQKAKSIGAKTQRERDYIDALALMYVDYDKLPHATRIKSYLKAMEALAAKYPADDEAQIFYAITLNTSASPQDKTYAQQLKGAAILEPIWKRQPLHPGIAHYLIHLYDYPAIASTGLEAAQRYAKIAPAAPHAQHMPSHIFTRVGYWKDSIASNIASAKSAREGKEYGDQMHATDYMVYAYLQLAQDDHARAAIAEQIATFAQANSINSANAGAYALAASPARLVFERGDWKAASQLPVRESPMRHATAITHFARAVGAARSGNTDAAKADIAELRKISAALREAKDSYWPAIVDIQADVASAWVLLAEGKNDEALKALSAASDAEDKTEKSPVTPGPLAPARELFGDMLMQSGQHKDALAAFEAVMKKEPNRFNAYAGAAAAADKLGDVAKAKAYYTKLAELAADSKSDRPVLVTARAYLAK